MLGGLGLGRLAEAALLAKNALGDGCVYGGWIVAEGGGGGGGWVFRRSDRGESGDRIAR